MGNEVKLSLEWGEEPTLDLAFQRAGEGMTGAVAAAGTAPAKLP